MDISHLLHSPFLIQLITTVALIVTVVILLRHLLTSEDTEVVLPPLPRNRIPVLGHLHLLDADVRKSFRRFREIVGDVYRLYFGARVVVVVSGLNTLKTALVKHGDCLLDRPSLFLVDQVTKNSGLVFSNGSKWKEHRRFTTSTLRYLSGKRTSQSRIETIVQQEIQKFIGALGNHGNSAFDPSDDVAIFSTNVMTSLLLGKTFESHDENFLSLIRYLEENMNDGGIAGILNFFPVLAKLPGDLFKYKKILANNKAIHKFIDESLNDTYTAEDGYFASVYMMETERLTKDGVLNTFSRYDLMTTIADILFAGADDMTTAIRWCLVALVTYPELQDKLFNDIQQNLPLNTGLSLTDRTQLSSLEAFYLEVLRFCNISVPTLPRSASRDFTLHGYHIPEGTMVMPDFDSVLMDKELWGDPEIFRPERHIDSDGNLRKHDGLVVFSLGKRNCVGESVARMELFLFLGSLIRNFKITNVDGLTMDKVDGQFGLAHRPNPFKIVLERRESV